MEINLPVSPPVNNNIQGNIYDKLDAITFEKVRVANSLLETKRSMQERVINKYRRDAERVHTNQTERLKREYRKIRTKKPDYVFDESDMTDRSRDRSQDVGRQRSLSDPSNNCSFCRRYYSHHYNVRYDSKKKDKDQNKPKKEHDFFNMTLRIFFLNMMKRANAHTSDHHHHEVDRESLELSHDREKIRIKPHSYDPRYPDQMHNEEKYERKRSHSVESWIKEQDELCDELKDLECQDEVNDLSSSLNTSKFSLESVNIAQPKPRLSHSLNVPSYTSIPEESMMDVKEDKDLWKRSKRSFEKIFAGLL